jgi:hypothetical protein
MDKDTSCNKATAALSTSAIFESLDANSRCLLKILLFFKPDSISLSLFEASDRSNFSPELRFWRNELRYDKVCALESYVAIAYQQNIQNYDRTGCPSQLGIYPEANRIAHNHDR